jgi:hypothetical protein
VSPSSARKPALSVSNRKELVDLGIFVTLLVLIAHLGSLPNPVRHENGGPDEKAQSHLSKMKA